MSLALSAEATENTVASGNHLLKHLRQQQAGRLWLSVAAGVMATLLLIAAWWLIANLIQSVLSISDVRRLDVLIFSPSSAAIPLVLLLRAFFLDLQDKWAQQASSQLRAVLRERVLSYWCSAPYRLMVSEAPSTHASRLLEDVDALDGYLSRYWPQQQLMLLSPLLIVSAIAWVNWLVALLMLLSAPLIPLFMSLIGMGAEQLNQRHLRQRQRLAGHFFDRLQKLAAIKRLQAAEQVAAEVAERSDDYRKVVMKTLRLAFLSSAVLEFFSSVAIAAVAIYIGFALFGAITFGPAEQLTLTSGLFILALAPEFFQPLRQFAQSYHDKAAALAAAEQLGPVFEASSEQLDSLAVTPLARDGMLATKNLKVITGDSKVVTTDLNLALQRGALLLISGPSGIGKTTLLNTLARLLPPHSGEVGWAEGTEPMAFYMGQQPWIVRGTIRDNLTLLGSQVSDEVLLQTLKQLGLETLCASTADLDRPLTERGEGVSGGQLQRLALARAFLRPYDLLFLDEPTASLDKLSRRYILQALSVLKTQSALVVVSHDPTLSDLADQQLTLSEAVDAAN